MTTDGTRNYFYDRENRLVKVVKIADGSTVATYEYDYRGLRISKTTPSGTIRYHWDNKDRLVRESDTNGNTLALYIYDDKDQLQAIEKGGAIYYTHTNARGDILAITDAAGNRVATYKYGPWGELLSQAGTFDQPFRYAGYYYDSETGMYYLKARYYSPDLGRFLTKDTFKGFNEEPQTLNLYAYANGNPVVNVDPTGRWSKTINVNSYLGVGSYIKGYITGSITNWGRTASIYINLYYKLTAGGLGLMVGTSIAGGALAKKIAAWVTRNLTIGDYLKGIFGATLGTWIFNRTIKTLSKKIASSLSYLDGLLIRVPYSSYVVKEGPIQYSNGWSI